MRLLAATLAFLLTASAAHAAQFVMYRSAGCGCCLEWVKHLRAGGHEVTVRNHPDMRAVKAKANIPATMQGCHTAFVGGYAIEGHVPLADIERLLKQRPDAVGLAVPGMPMGSPGMEHGDHVQPYKTYLIKKDGSRSVWASHG